MVDLLSCDPHSDRTPFTIRGNPSNISLLQASPVLVELRERILWYIYITHYIKSIKKKESVCKKNANRNQEYGYADVCGKYLISPLSMALYNGSGERKTTQRKERSR